MWMDLYNFTHNSLGMHFWELPALIVGAVVLVELIVHSYRQKKREEESDEERTERLESMQKEASGNAAASV